jgi:hypothetical protein
MAIAAGAAVAVGGAVVSGVSSNKAADAQRDAAQQANDSQTALANQQMQFAQQQNAPYTTAGASAIDKISSILNGTAGGTTGTGAYDLTQIPGYQFGLNQGMENIQNRAGAAGTQLSGNTLRDLQSFGQGYAGTAYNNYLSQLSGVAGLGQASANNSVASNTNALGNLSNSIGNNLIGAGNANAAASIASGNALNGAAGQVANNYSQQQLLGNLFSTSPASTSTSQLNAGLINPNAYSNNYG